MAKNENLEIVIHDIVHQLRTSIVVTHASIMVVKNYMPTLIKAYQLAKRNDFNLKDIPHKKLMVLERLLENSENQLEALNEKIKKLIVCLAKKD